MKFYAFKQIVHYLQKFKRISAAHRVGDNIIKITFDGKNDIYFDLQKGNSAIYKRSDSVRIKHYQAPFDVLLNKYLGRSEVLSIEIINSDKVLRLEVSQSGAYKANRSFLQLEFTGKYTNAILLDEDGVILDALRHVDIMNSYREIKPGIKLEDLHAPSFTPKEGEDIGDVEAYLEKTYQERTQKQLHNRQHVEAARVDKKIQRMKKELSELQDEDKLLKEAEENFEKGNLALANMHLIKPYAKSVKLYDFTGAELELELPEGARNAAEVGELFFKKAKKAKQKASNLHIEREGLSEKIDFLERFRANIMLTQTPEELQLLIPPQKKKAKKEAPKPYEVFWIEGQKVLLGKNKKGNIELLKIARAGDIWMHIQGMPSTHVIIQTSKQNVSEKVLYAAAKLCVDFSTTKIGSFLVDYTNRREVKVQSEANVLYNKYKTLRIDKER
jgi:predicted ribosome quality control (RQC) complex YloA/Tae2 family protein